MSRTGVKCVPASRSTVLVLGGAGFIGRHTATALLALGHRVIIGSRHAACRDRRLSRDLLTCERRAVRFENMRQSSDWSAVLDGVDAIVNCVGILRQRGRETYDRVHRRAPETLAAACLDRGLRLVHVSALGLARGRSRFLQSKRHGEHVLLQSAADVVVVRPSLLDGDGGFGARWLRRVANWPLHPYPANARGRIAALDVRDLAVCLATHSLARGERLPEERRVAELGGPRCHDIAQLLSILRSKPGRAVSLAIPAALVRLAAHVCDLLHVTPLSYGHYELLQVDNAPRNDVTRALLGTAPRAISVNGRHGHGENIHPVAGLSVDGDPG